MIEDPEPTDALVERLEKMLRTLIAQWTEEDDPAARMGLIRGVAEGVATSHLARLRTIGEPEPQSAAADALDDICVLIGAPAWQYPGQVVRDVAMELGISLDEMAERLKSATPTDEPEEGEDD